MNPNNELCKAIENYEEYKCLIKSNDNDKYSGKLAAKNIRIELRKKFKDVKFSVRKSHFGSLNISWTDGPRNNEVEEITSKYKTGRFNAYEDYHYSESSPFNEVFGGSDFIFLNRDYSDDFIKEAIGVLVDKYESYFEHREKPTVEDYRKGRLYNQGQDICVRSFQDVLRKIINEL